MCPSTSAPERCPPTRRARGNAFRRTASCQHSVVGWTCAPRPGARRSGSGTRAGEPSASEPATTRSSSLAVALPRQPTQVRTGPGAGVSEEVTTASTLLRADPRGEMARHRRGSAHTGSVLATAPGSPSSRPRCCPSRCPVPAWSSRPRADGRAGGAGGGYGAGVVRREAAAAGPPLRRRRLDDGRAGRDRGRAGLSGRAPSPSRARVPRPSGCRCATR